MVASTSPKEGGGEGACAGAGAHQRHEEVNRPCCARSALTGWMLQDDVAVLCAEAEGEEVQQPQGLRRSLRNPGGLPHALLFDDGAGEDKLPCRHGADLTRKGTYLRLAKMPRGPTLYFKVEEYTLSKDIAASQRRPHSPGTEYLVSPLIVLNNMQVSCCSDDDDDDDDERGGGG
eukprot:754715-Hanusia_phi.AAC.1